MTPRIELVERRVVNLLCQFDLPGDHRCDGVIEVWNARMLIRTEPCPCRCHK